MENCKIVSTPMLHKLKLCKDDGIEKVDETNFRSLVGFVMYLTPRFDILHVVSVILRFLHCASEVHLQVAKNVLKYIKETLDYDVLFYFNQEFNFHGFFDCDWGGSLDDMKNTSSYCFAFGFGVFSWTSKK